MATALGEAKSRAVPEHIIASQPTASYKDWATPGSDLRCPICLDDVRSLSLFATKHRPSIFASINLWIVSSSSQIARIGFTRVV